VVLSCFFHVFLYDYCYPVCRLLKLLNGRCTDYLYIFIVVHVFKLHQQSLLCRDGSLTQNVWVHKINNSLILYVLKIYEFRAKIWPGQVVTHFESQH